MKTAAQAQAKYAASAPTAQASWVAGIQGTTKDQAALAVAAIPRMVAGFNDAANSGRIAQGLTRRGTPYWKSQSEAKAPSYSLGITNGQGNYGAAAAKFIPAIQSIVNGLPPRGDIMQNLQRVQGLALGLHQLKGSLGAR